MQNLTVSGQGSSTKDVCIMYLSCIGELSRYFMHFSPDFLRKYEFRTYIYNTNPMFTDIRRHMNDYIDRTKVLIYHPIDILPYPSEMLDPYADWIEALPSSIQKIGVPQPHLHFLWPFHAHDPRSDDPDRPANRFGTQPFIFYGDSYVMKLIREGLDQEEIIHRYLNADLSQEVNLDDMYNNTKIILERQDKHSEIKVSDFVLSNFRDKALFQSINHPNNRLMFEIGNKILTEIACEPVPAIVLDQTQQLQALEMPIHPSLLRYFNVTFANENTRYEYDYKKLLTFSEYVREYVYFEDGVLNSMCYTGLPM